MKTMTIVISGEKCDDFDLILDVMSVATRYGCVVEGNVDGDKIERAASLDDALRHIEKLATAWLQP